MRGRKCSNDIQIQTLVMITEGRSTSEIVRLTKMTRQWVFKYRKLHTGEREELTGGGLLSSENRSLIMSFISNFPRITLIYAL